MKKIIIALITFILYSFPVTIFAAETDVKIPVQCNENTDSNEKYSVKIFPEAENSGIIDKSSINLAGNNEDVFLIKYDNVGTYKYKVIQEAGKNKNIKYDNTVYNADVYVVEENGKIIAEPVIYKNGSSEKSDACIFDNIVISDSKPEDDNAIDVIPTITGEIIQDENTATQKNTAPLNTGDNNNIVFISLLMLSCIAISGIIIAIRVSKQK